MSSWDQGRPDAEAAGKVLLAGVSPNSRAIVVRDLRGLAAVLNDRGIRTARGGRWHVSNVKNVIDRAGG